MGKQLTMEGAIEINDDFSRRDFTGQDLTDWIIPSCTIYGSCFSQENPDSEVFPKDMKEVTFYNCNLDNCFIPDGNTVIGGSNRRFKIQNDLRDWEINKDNHPTKIINQKHWELFGYSVDPKDIPSEKLESLDHIAKASEGVIRP